MTRSISLGKWRGLKTTSSQSNTFSILAFDQRGSFRKMLPDDAPYETYVQIKSEVVSAIAPYATAVLLDPIYGLQSAIEMSGSSGLLMAVEKTGYSGVARARRVDFIEGWSVEKIKQMGASAAKILVYYHPDAGDATEHIEENIRFVANKCKQHDLPLFVEPVIYSPYPDIEKNSAGFAEQRPQILQETVKRLSQAGADVLKIEFPVDINFDSDKTSWLKACQSISDVSSVPWALLSAGVDFESFISQVEVACQGGASGFLGGRAIWKESITMTSSERKQFLQSVAIKRMQQLHKIVDEYAKPWTDYYIPPQNIDDWFKTYMTA
jgi:tagatose 1,6-diphosphate aldolase